MKFVLILMVRNESRILERCLKSVESFVDAFCIHDTGSTDDTLEIAKKFMENKDRAGCITQSTWKDFGTNRTASFHEAQKYLKMVGWDLTTTYGLLLDADMIFHPGSLREQTLGEIGYSVIQCGGTLEYPNCRLVRMDHPWKCVGVTHEYWDGVTSALPKTVCWIQDQNDGGCKADKFERDARLLEGGLRENPKNERYMFYLAQTYHSLGRWRDSIAMYKRRIAAGGWYEENWYSHYMIADCYLRLNDPIRFEAWMLRAIAKDGTRAEPYYKLTKYFREQSQHYKAYGYWLKGSKIPLSTASLFVETDVYTGLFDYEQSILEFYVHPGSQDGLRASVNYWMKGRTFQASVLSNLEFYVRPIGVIEPLNLPSPFGSEYRPSAVSIRSYPYANVRYVNYWIENGDYKTPPGKCVMTENAFVNLETGAVVAMMKDASIQLPRRDVAVKGLEDIRLYGSDRFTATVQEYSDGVRVLDGRYNIADGTYDECKVLESPDNRRCEKNWLPVADTGNIIYDWHPLRVLGPNACVHSTPPMFSMFRGSAPPVLRGDEWWTLVHFVNYSKPRKYYHCVVVLDKSFKPIRFSLPFVFRAPAIEYCVSMIFTHDVVKCFISMNDKDSSVCSIRLDEFHWRNL